jgi:glycosyltransferase involved in cell wall biosynthesis
MNILFLTAYVPVLHMHGGGVRMYHNIRILSEQHSVRVISFVEDDKDRERLKTVEAICESVTAVQRIPDFRPHWLSVKPFLVREFSTSAMYAAVDHACRNKKVDVIQCEYLQMSQYRRRGPLSILTIHEALSSNAYQAFQKTRESLERFRLFYRWMSMLNYEISMCNRFDRVVTMTREDADYLRSYAHRAGIRHIPIGIDTGYFRPSLEEIERPVEVLFVGNFRHAPNVEAADFLLSEIAPHFPDVQFVIAGSHVPDTLPHAPNAVFPGYIADTRDLFHVPNTIFVAPIFSGSGQ